MSQINSIDYNALISNHTIISRTDSHGIITYVNDKFCELSGYAHDELLGQSHNIVRHPDVSSRVYENLWSTIQNNQVWCGTLRNVAKDKSEYYIKATIIPLIDEYGQKEGYMSMHYHITEDKVEKLHLKKQLFLYKSECIKHHKEFSMSKNEQKKELEYVYSKKYGELVHALEDELLRLRTLRKHDVQNIACLENELRAKKEYIETFNSKSKKMIYNLSTERQELLTQQEHFKRTNKVLEAKVHKAQESVTVFQGYIDEYRKKIEDLKDVIASYEKEKKEQTQVQKSVTEEENSSK